MAARGRPQLFGSVTGVRDVMIEEWEVDPMHVPGAELSSQGQPPKIAAEVVVHTFVAKPDDHGAKIERFEKSEAQEPAKVGQGVLVGYLDEVGPLLGKELLQPASLEQELAGVDGAIGRVQGCGGRSHAINLAVAAHVFDT